MQDLEDPISQAPRREPWNKGKLTGAKPPLRPKHGLVDSEQAADRRTNTRSRDVQSGHR